MLVFRIVSPYVYTYSSGRVPALFADLWVNCTGPVGTSHKCGSGNLYIAWDLLVHSIGHLVSKSHIVMDLWVNSTEVVGQ